jgi:D-alanine-D-alanine ligase
MSSRSAPSGETSLVGVCFGGPSPEHDVSVLTGLQAVHELARSGRPVTGLYWSKTGEWFEIDPSLEASSFVEGVPRSAQSLQLVTGPEGGFFPAQRGRGLLGGSSARGKALQIDVIVNCCHGGPGEDGSLQGAFDLAGLRYTGPNVVCAALGMDKLAFTGLASSSGLPVLSRVILDSSTTEDQLGFAGPFIVKPRFGGSSIGIEVVADLDSAKALFSASSHLQRGAVVEPYRDDLFDINVAVRSWPSLELSAVERPERTTLGAEILGYADKYVGSEGMASAPRELPAKIPTELLENLRGVARRAADLVGVRGVMRVDFLSDGRSELWLNEVNTIPGSLARYLWVDPVVPFGDLLGSMIEEAQKVPASRPSAAGADGTVLRMAGSIAGKLG